MKKLAAKYMVARNFSPRELSDTEALDCWERVFECVASDAAKADTPVVKIVDDLGKIFPESPGRGAPMLLSAASKFLWFSGRFDVRIYDSRAVKALNTLRSGGTRADGRRGWRVNGSH